MRSLNKVSLIGNLGGNPAEVRYLEGGVAVTKITLATTESFKDKSGITHYSTDWHTIVLWRGLAELAVKYLTKGSLVYIEGKLKTRNYEGKDASTRYVTEIIAENLIMLDKKTSGPTSEPPVL